jgi:hypothetical protein
MGMYTLLIYIEDMLISLSLDRGTRRVILKKQENILRQWRRLIVDRIAIKS